MSASAKTIPGPTSGSPAITLARIGPVTKGQDGVEDNAWVDVHFNPATLQLQISNELKDPDKKHPAQYVAKTTSKLSVDLQFDCTDTGQNVLETTRKLQALLAPRIAKGQTAEKDPPPPLALFEWGTFTFKGVVESYAETLDFFSANGVALRSLVKLSLKQQDVTFEPGGAKDPPPDPSFDVIARSPAEAAKDENNPAAARGIAAANGQESLRFSAGASLTVNAGVQLKGPAGFVSAGAGLSLNAGAGASAGLGLGGGAGISLGAGAGAGVGLSANLTAGGSGGAGISGLARLSATEGAFAGLRVNATVPTSRRDRAPLRRSPGSGGLATGAGADFQVGGRASVQGAAGLRTNVDGSRSPGSGSLNAKLSFDSL